MLRPQKRWRLPALVLAIPLAALAFSAIAGPGDRHQGSTDQAKEMAELMGDGQLDLTGAVELAEKHCKGIALEVRCNLQGAQSDRPGAPGEKPAPGGAEDPAAKSAGGERLIYEVSCFVKDKDQVQTIRVDGKNKRVMEDKKPPKEAKPGEPAMPPPREPGAPPQ